MRASVAALGALLLVVVLSAVSGAGANSAAEAAPDLQRATAITAGSAGGGIQALADTQAAIASLQRATTTTTAAPTTTTTVAPTTTTTTAPPPPPAPAVQPAATSSGYNDPGNPAAWDRLAQCESGGNWAINTGNGYYGGLQFSLTSWQGVGGTGYPHEASRETQIAMAQRLYHSGGGWAHWPACSSKLGYR